MDQTKYQLNDDVILDVRRAVWLERERVLVISDLHLGYAWAQRYEGQLMPIGAPDDTVSRIDALCREYRPAQLILLGDIVHRALPVQGIESELRQLLAAVDQLQVRPAFILGNHDRHLEKLFAKLSFQHQIQRDLAIGRFEFRHGDNPNVTGRASVPSSGGLDDLSLNNRCLFMGHEHPAISLGDGVSSHMKCPCFLVSDHVIILPAFSRWAAGTSINSAQWNSQVTEAISFSKAIAICNDKLLPIDL